MSTTIAALFLAEQTSVLDIDPGTMLWTLVAFAALLFVLGRFAWRPLLASMEKREKGIRESIEQAERLKREAEELLVSHQRKMEEADEEVKRILDEGREQAGAIKEKILSEARQSAKNTVDRAGQEIAAAREEALAQIRREAVDLSVSLASKVIRRSLSQQDHEELLRESMKELRI